MLGTGAREVWGFVFGSHAEPSSVKALTTTLRYYRSEDSEIAADDTEVGESTVPSVPAGSSSSRELSIDLVAPTAGTYYYGACTARAWTPWRTNRRRPTTARCPPGDGGGAGLIGLGGRVAKGKLSLPVHLGEF